MGKSEVGNNNGDSKTSNNSSCPQSESNLTKYKSTATIDSVIYFDSNTYRYWLILLFVGFIVYKYISGNILSITWLFFTILFGTASSIITDYFYYFWGICYYDPHEVIVRGYSFSVYFNDTLHSVGLDYGFNYYNGNYKKSRSQAQIDKFKYAVKQLGIKEGDRVIDVGCGCGDWLYYLQNTMKCKVVGVNITDAQAQQARGRGLTIYTTNWKDIKKKPEISNVLYGQFDVVTFWDTVEHYVPFGRGIWRRNKRKIIYQDMFQLAKDLTDPNSRLKKVWISCLHMRYEALPAKWWRRVFCPNEIVEWKIPGKRGKLDNYNKIIFNPWTVKETLWKWYSIYLLDKYHSGFYPSYYQEKGKFYDELVDNGEAKGYQLKWREDATYDYYMTSILNPTHFGRHKFKWTIDRVFAFALTTLFDPYWLHRSLWFTVEAWMEQFDTQEFEKSFVLLWWLVLGLDDDDDDKEKKEKNQPQGNGAVTN